MKRFLAFLALSAAPVLAGVDLRISVDPARGLPAIPPTLRVTVRNSGPATFSIPERAALRVTRDDGTSFIAHVGHRGDFFVAEVETGLSIAPGETADLTWWSSPDSPPWFEADPRVFPPGDYRLVLVLDDRLDSERLAGLNDPLDQPGLIAPLVSNVASYTVAVPDGADAAVWSRIRSLEEPVFWAATLAHEIWSASPTSSYAPMAVPNSTNMDEQIRFFEQAIARAPEAVRADWHRLAIATIENQRLLSFLSAGNVEDAGKASDRARSLLAKIEKDTPDPKLRKRVSEVLDVVMTREEILEKHKIFTGQTPPEVYPYIECIERSTGQTNLWLGYGNTGAAPISLGIGARNKFTPPPLGRGQPTEFKPGVHHAVFKITVGHPQVIWHLDQSNVVIRLADVPPCPAGVLTGG